MKASLTFFEESNSGFCKTSMDTPLEIFGNSFVNTPLDSSTEASVKNFVKTSSSTLKYFYLFKTPIYQFKFEITTPVLTLKFVFTLSLRSFVHPF